MIIYLLSKRVDLNEVLNDIEEKNKAIAFFEYASALMNNSIELVSKDLPKSNKFAIQHIWLLNHPKLHWFYIFSLKYFNLFSKRILNAFVNKSALKYIFVRLKDPEWWRLKFSS